MGLTTVEVEVAAPNNGDNWARLESLVDSGAVHSVVPAAVLDRLGIRPVKEEVLSLANGERITRRKGIAAFRLGAPIGGADVVFGEPGDSNLLGALTLEALGLALDPLKRELRELPMLL